MQGRVILEEQAKWSLEMKSISLRNARKVEGSGLDHHIRWQKMHLSSGSCAVIASVSYSFLVEDLTVVDDIVVFFKMVPPLETPPPPMLHMPLPLPVLKLLRPPDPP
uniref:Uncharacterized protein n=1 Tax=Sphaerodactylus townsendi TaxID=933632 RepID=A0ACB8ELF8_9SAUR